MTLQTGALPLEETSLTLEERIEEAKRKVERGENQREPQPRDRSEFSAQAISRIDDSLPEELREFVVYAGELPDEQTPQTWKPSFFKIEAPGLLPMSFMTQEVAPGGSLKVASIRVGAQKFGTDWDGALVAAALPVDDTKIEARR